jgi:hypothetical protein
MSLLIPLLIASSSNIYLQYGAGMYDVKHPHDSQFFSLELSNEVLPSVRLVSETGLYTRLQTGEQGRRGSAFFDTGIGIRPKLTGDVFVESYWCIGAITAPDSNLGGVFNFFNTTRLGVIGKDGIGLSVWFKHISSAGINSPNKGREWLGLSWIFSFR